MTIFDTSPTKNGLVCRFQWGETAEETIVSAFAFPLFVQIVMKKGLRFLHPSPWFHIWCARRDSNARPLAPEANALSDWATGAEFPRKGTLQSWEASSCAASCQAVCSGTGSVLRLVWCRSRVFVSIRLLRFPFFFFILRSIPWAFPLLGTVIPILRFLAATWLFS